MKINPIEKTPTPKHFIFFLKTLFNKSLLILFLIYFFYFIKNDGRLKAKGEVYGYEIDELTKSSRSKTILSPTPLFLCTMKISIIFGTKLVT